MYFPIPGIEAGGQDGGDNEEENGQDPQGGYRV
jgi:hypothetical protein